MKRILFWMVCAVCSLNLATAQSAKTHPPAPGPSPAPERLTLRGWPGQSAVPQTRNPFGLSGATFKPLNPLTRSTSPDGGYETVNGEQGLPIFFQGKTAASLSADANRPVGARALDYLASLEPDGLTAPAAEFMVKRVDTDEQGEQHVHLEQQFQGVPVYGGELIAHTKNGAFSLLNGRYYPTPQLTTTVPTLDATAAIQAAVQAIGADHVKTNWTAEERLLVGGAETTTELVVYHANRSLSAERLAWQVIIYPNLLRREVYFVDAQSGAIIHHYDHTCEILPLSGKAQHDMLHELPGEHTDAPAPVLAPALLDGPVPASGLDLLNQNRSFGAWLVGSTVVMEDASKQMFNSGASQMPSSPVGAIVTLNALNTSPEIQSTFDFDFVTSASSTFNNKNAVSAHWNAVQSYDYFLSKHTRNSIDGVGGNIISFFNVSESNGTSMENAYWNGAAMWYGNGGSTFYELARGIDVGGHEMTHGVIEKTANLEYQDESGALNESFADVFAVFIDPADWKIGEDVVKPGATTNNCLRDMQDPHKSDPAQPNHVSEKYTGNQDNGGVHINSGIPNRAFYLFASNASVGIAKAEKVYYKALRDYLVKSSQFIDCRLAVIQAANDLYGGTVANAAADAFTTVGIVGSQGGNYLGELSVNPGTEYVVCATEDLSKLDITNSNGQVLKTLYTEGVASRPSVSDDGTKVAFVNAEGHIVGIDILYDGSTIVSQATILSDFAEWRSVAISKDGRYLAALTTVQQNRIHVYDLNDVFLTKHTFFLYNPTYSTGQITGEVKYADVLDFDYTGEYLMYDAYNDLSNDSGEDLSYWDIGFLRFLENGQIVDGANAFIGKLFSGLPEKTGVADPSFAKKSPYVIALDVIDDLNDTRDILGANTETGDVDFIVKDNGVLGWPSFNKQDNTLIFDRVSGSVTNVYKRGLTANKITGQGAVSQFIPSRNWGVWLANGVRSLLVDADEPAAERLQLTAAPNPATETVQISFAAPQSGPVRIVLSDLLGKTLLSRDWELPAGNNQLDLNLQGLPSGTYALRVQAGGTGATLKVSKL